MRMLRRDSRTRSALGNRQESDICALSLGCVVVLNVGCESTAEVDDSTAKVEAVARA